MGEKRKKKSQAGTNIKRIAFSSTPQEIERIFQKNFQFHRQNNWLLPPMNQFFVSEPWIVDELKNFKKELNDTKGLISSINLKAWDDHTNYTHLTGGLRYSLRRLRPELMTQAWLKFTEILYTYPLIPVKNGNQLRTLHLCEAPGAFISSLNHYLAHHGIDGLQWTWLANSLNPYYEGNGCQQMIGDDRLIRATYGNWIFGSDNTGDIFSSAVQEEIINRASNMDLVTADGSVDCQMNPGEQEAKVSHLHCCEAFIALQVLNPDGTLVLKMFTFFESSSFSLLYLLNIVFSKVRIFKPVSSKPGNSEVYVICLGYKRNEELISRLAIYVKDFKAVDLNNCARPIFPKNIIPKNFKPQMKSCCEMFTNWQKETILNNVKVFECMSAQKRDSINKQKKLCILKFQRKFRVQALHDYQRLIKQNIFTKFYFGIHYSSESQDEKEKTALASWEQQVAKMATTVSSFKSTLISGEQELLNFLKLTLCDEQVNWSQLKDNIIQGKPIERILSSRLCEDVVLSEWIKLQDNVTYISHPVEGSVIPPLALEELFQYLLNTNTNHVTILTPFEKNPDVQCIQEFLKNKGVILGNPEDFTKTSDSNGQLPQRRIIFVDCVDNNCEKTKEELASHLNLVNCFFNVGEDIDIGETDLLVLNVSTIMSRISSSFLFLLYQTYEEILIIPSVILQNAQLRHYIIANRARSSDFKHLLEFLKTVRQVTQDNWSSVMEIFPFIKILDTSFFDSLKGHCMWWLLNAMSSIITREIDYLKDKAK